MSQNSNDHCVKLQKSYVILFAFLEDVVLSHAHRLHDQLHSLQVDVAILCQVALQTNSQTCFYETLSPTGNAERHKICDYTHSGFVHNVFVDVDQSIDRSLSVRNKNTTSE